MKLAARICALALFAVYPSLVHADVYWVVNTNDVGAGSLRQAILDANAHAGPDGIFFQIPGAGLHVITPQSSLPPLTGPTIVTGLTEEGSTCSSWPPTLRVAIDGFQAGPNVQGLRIFGDDSLIAGLVIRNFSGFGLDVQNNQNTTVRCNFIGTTANGRAALPNSAGGIRVFSSENSEIGGTLVSRRNLISGNGGPGISLAGDSVGTEVIGNYIGTDVDGMEALPNTIGVSSTSPDVTIGGPAAGASNLISGNSTGILVFGSNASGNLIFGNEIGLDAEGEPALGNVTGISVNGGASAALVGATLEGFGNTIAGNTSNGVLLFNNETTLGITIRGNAIYENGGLGIALNGSGTDPTPNDPGDEDEGPNRLQNFPELLSASQNGEAPIEVEYFVDSIPGNSGYPITVDFYVADVNDQEGRSWIASDEFEAADFVAGEPVVSSIFLFLNGAGPHELVATATDADGNTSEFSSPVTVPEPRMSAAFVALVLSAFARRRHRGREVEEARRGRGRCRGTPE